MGTSLIIIAIIAIICLAVILFIIGKSNIKMKSALESYREECYHKEIEVDRLAHKVDFYVAEAEKGKNNFNKLIEAENHYNILKSNFEHASRVYEKETKDFNTYKERASRYENENKELHSTINSLEIIIHASKKDLAHYMEGYNNIHKELDKLKEYTRSKDLSYDQLEQQFKQLEKKFNSETKAYHSLVAKQRKRNEIISGFEKLALDHNALMNQYQELQIKFKNK